MAFKEMYPAVAGSPTTTTENTFVAGTTTSITVSQGSVLASAPNLATITAADGRFVTVSYTSKSGNTISGLTALEGDTTGTFAIGSTIARRYSAVDDSAIKDNLGEIYDQMITSIKANGTPLAVTNKSVNIPLATNSQAGLRYNSYSCIRVYVSPSGSDTTGDGTQGKPWREIQTALERTANLGYEWARVDCSGGSYNTPINTGFNFPNCMIFALGEITTPKMEFNQNCGKVILSCSSSTTNFNVITTEDYGITLAYGCSLLKQTGVLNVTAAQQGIRVGGQNSATNPPFKWFIQSISLMGTTNITITNGSGSYGGVSCYFPTSRLDIDNLNIDNPNATGIRLTNHSHICSVNSLTCNGTQYSLAYGSLLSIGGKWVNQSK